MRSQRDQLVLGLAFVAAIALHAVLLPWVGQAVGSKSLEPQPDWAVTAFSVERQADAGQAVRVTWNHDEIAGVLSRLDLPQSRTVRFVLSRDRVIDEQDNELYRDRYDGYVSRLDETGKLDHTLFVFAESIELPSDADGPYWVILQDDADEELPDRDRSNNTRVAPIYIDGPQSPELAIETFNAPDRATPGGAILIDYAVQNTGQGWARGLPPRNFTLNTQPVKADWIDRVYLSPDAKLDETDSELRGFDRTAPLKPGGEYRHARVELEIPRGVTGPMHLILVADADQVLDQPSFTASLQVHPITLVDTGAPDLIVATINKPDRLVINRPKAVTFSIANLASTPTLGASWVDGLYLSRQPVLDASSIRVGQAPAGEPLEPRSRYETTATVTLTEFIEPGPWFLVVKADAEDAIDEQGFDDNNTLAVPIMVLTEAQADAEIQLGNPDRPERLVVQWIEHDRLEEHIARLSRTVQPALQDRADPVPDAPLINDPKPPTVASTADTASGDPSNTAQPLAPDNQQDARPRPTTPDATQTDVAPRPQQPGSLTPQRIDGLPGTDGTVNPQRDGIDNPTPPIEPRPIDPTPSDDNAPTPAPGERLVESPADPTAPDTDRTTDSQTPADQESDTDQNNVEENDSNEPAEQTTDTQSDTLTTNPDVVEPSEQDGQGDAEEKQDDESTAPKPDNDPAPKPDGQQGEPASPSEEQTPTRAPRDDSEAPPVSIEKIEVALQEGKVLVGRGIKVTTKLPDPPGVGARTLAFPRNARVRVTFTRDGQVYEAKVIRSTTYPEWDAAIEASLYRWTAQGEAVDNAEPYIAIEWNYILNDLFDEDE